MIRSAEGMPKFQPLHHATASIPVPPHALSELCVWRDMLYDLGLIGQDPARYQGAPFGNVSLRIAPEAAPVRARSFVVSAGKTGGIRNTAHEHYTLVRAYDERTGVVESEGPRQPSSESLTHGVLYDLFPEVRAVFHVHSPVPWRARRVLGLPTIPPEVESGAPAMALALEAMRETTSLLTIRVFAMDGHEDGLVSFGETCEQAGLAMIAVLARSRALLTANTP